MPYTYQEINSNNWIDFETMFLKHKGVRGGCWCSYYLGYASEIQKLDRDGRKNFHKDIVMSGLPTGIIIYEDLIPIGWAQVSNPQVIKRFNHNKIYSTTEFNHQPRWRISCIFVDKDHRKQGLSKIVMSFAFEYIKSKGGGVLEVFPFNYEGVDLDKFQFNGSVSFYEELGFEKVMMVSSSELLMIKEIKV